MKKPLFFLSILTILLISCQSAPTQEEATEAKSPQWVSLFNGEDLDGWLIRITGKPFGENFGNTFRVEDGILKIRYDEYGSFDEQFGALYYNRPFTNYRLKAEYRFVGETAPGAPSWGFRDSGVQYHGQDPRNMPIEQQFPVCLEYNLHGGNGTDERPDGQICAIGMTIEIDGHPNESFCTDPTIKRTFHGDQWVTLEIDVQDDQIRHFVNGEEILAFSNPALDPNHEIAKTLIRDGNTAVHSGFVSLQSNSHPIDFRKIEIMEY